FCKPDALYGPHSRVDRERAVALLSALAAMCCASYPVEVDCARRPAVRRAAVQVAERSATESAFRGTVYRPEAAAALLAASAQALPAGPSATRDVLRLAVEGLGFSVGAEHRLVLGEQGVDAVYGGVTTTVEFGQVRSDLVAYLAAEEVDVWLLSGGQEACVLQWWKTYVRHVLLDRRPGEYLLRNLVHVCDGPDGEYLIGRVRG
ncbi:hypothetical protein, partial [Streptomyces kasugaensis]|uniref:hypothetical protein n=1 Tax=Streptomyces kasugaensis TaxID=1946 RepID=UPI001A940CF6